MTPDWTKQDDETIEKMISDRCTMQQICEAISKTRNAVAGRISRLRKKNPGRFLYEKAYSLRFTGRGHKPKEAPKKASVAATAKKVSVIFRQEPKKVTPPPVRIGLPTITDLRLNECRFPVAVDIEDTHLFCGAGTDIGASYCAQHHSIVYQRGTR